MAVACAIQAVEGGMDPGKVAKGLWMNLRQIARTSDTPAEAVAQGLIEDPCTPSSLCIELGEILETTAPAPGSAGGVE